jgi:purine-nucleoside phosphorylase
MHQSAHIQEARDYILNRINTKPVVGMILGSGLGALADEIENATVIPYTEIPYFAQSEAIGHANERPPSLL